MNVSDKYKLILIAPARTSTRSIIPIFWKRFEFKNIVTHVDSYTHEVDGYDHSKYFDYKIITLVRNPYSKQVSSWQMECVHHGAKEYDTFEKYLNVNPIGWLYSEHSIIEYCKVHNRNLDYIIHYEKMTEDIISLPFLEKSEEILSEIDNLKINSVKNEFEDRKNEGRFRDYKKHYTQELAEKVYLPNKILFDTFGYDKDSWKY